MANRNYLLVDAGINHQIRCLQIPGRYINVRDLCSSPPSRKFCDRPIAHIKVRLPFFIHPVY